MSRRSLHASGFTPNYAILGEKLGCTVKLYYGGVMKHSPQMHYVGGNIEYFDFANAGRMGMLDLWGYAGELGYFDTVSYKLWHKYGESLSVGHYLKTDADFLFIRKHLPDNHEVEIFIEELGLQTGDIIPTVQSQIASSVILDEPVNANKRKRLHKLVDESDNDEEDDDFYDSEYDFEEDDQLFDEFVDPEAEFNASTSKGKSTYVSDDVYAKMLCEDGDDDCAASDSMGSDVGSDEEHSIKYPKFNPKTDMKNPDLVLGMVFSSKKEAKFAIETHCLRRGMCVRFGKNDKVRLRATCRNEGCGWAVQVSPMQNDYTWQIRSYVSEHKNCYWNYNNSSLKSNWIGKTFVKKFKDNPKLGTSEFRTELCTTLKANVSRSQAYRAKQHALKEIQGTVEEQFKSMRNYCEELKRVDPNATVILKLTEDEEGPRFQRLYICFSALKEGFKAACRPVVGVDGCFLKGQNGGQLLAAVGLDPNNNIYPISYAIVEGETKDTWLWFLKLLDGDLEIEQNQHTWTFMSDKQKGLIPAFEELFPHADNRFCVRHLHSNMKKDGFGGLAIKHALWAAAKATRVEEFNRRMEELKEIDERAYIWLAKKSPQHWTRSYFNAYPKCDILLNNMCECFNSFILDARERPMIPLLETIRNLLMTRMVLNRDKVEKWDSAICPKIRNVLVKNMKDAGECIPMRADDWHYQIMGPFDQHTVDMQLRTCSCKKWDLNGIPCKHAICAIWCKKDDPEKYVHKCYSVETYKKAYEKSIKPITSAELWPQCSLQPPLPPIYKEKKGRPQKLRRREPDEPPAPGQTKLKKSCRTNKCRRCGQTGHNVRRCGQSGGTHESRAEENVMEPPTNPSDPQPTTQTQPQPQSTTQPQPNKRGKHEARRPSNVGINIGHMSNATTSVTINQGSAANILVKGGVNYITLSNLKASVGNQDKGASTSTPHSMRPPLTKTPPSRTAPGSLSALRTRSTPTPNPTRTSTKEDGTSSKTRSDASSL